MALGTIINAFDVSVGLTNRTIECPYSKGQDGLSLVDLLKGLIPTTFETERMPEDVVDEGSWIVVVSTSPYSGL